MRQDPEVSSLLYHRREWEKKKSRLTLANTVLYSFLGALVLAYLLLPWLEK